MDTDSFIVYIEAKQIYVDITEDDGTRINTSNYEIDRPLPKETIMRKFVISILKTYSYLTETTKKTNSKREKKQKISFED